MKKIQCITQTAIMAALSVIFSFIIIWKMPQGGTVTIGCMLPIIIIAIRCGVSWGIMAGVVSGLLQFILSGVVVHPLSILLDYLLAYGVIGLAGIFKGGLKQITFGTTIVCILRFVFHLISGATIFASYAPEGQNPWIYSLTYNCTYMVPELLVTIVEVVMLYKFANRLFVLKK